MTYRRKWPYLITAKFGYGHPYRLRSGMSLIRRSKRYVQFSNLLFMHIEHKVVLEFAQKFMAIRPLSIYTKRGITLSRRIFVFKQGKNSQYSQLKSKIF